ncbi:MAG: hypothetical protein F6K18_11835 [Okeania sp. SIO2C2]|nr:hypothetical protein [Okeania sp. SIO2C2]
MQKKIYQSLGGTKEYNREVWEKFGEQVGWKKGDKWLDYDELNWILETSSHYTGHLPFKTYPFTIPRDEIFRFIVDCDWLVLSSLAQRLVECNI